MFIVSSFDYTTNVEPAIASLREKGVDKQHILAVPLLKKEGSLGPYGSPVYSERVNLLDVPAILGCIFMLLGCIYGFVWRWGPVLLGLIGLVAGLFAGFLANFILYRSNLVRENNKSPGIVLFIYCHIEQADSIEKTLLSHCASGLARINRGL